jgi:ABC-type lipoprotein export system ATPase subunit
MSNTLRHGAQWVRADFHLHTITDPGRSRQFRKEYEDKENSFNKDWVAKLVENDIKVAVITNHNHFDFDAYKNLRKLASKESILLLPGVELGIAGGKTGVHTLITFDPDSWVFNQENDDTINRFLSSVFSQTPDEGSNTRQTIPEILELLDGYHKDYFLTFAHVDTDNGLLSEHNYKTLQELVKTCGERWSRRVLAFQKLKNTTILNDHWNKFAPEPALVEGSDPKSIDEVAVSERECYLKLGELSYSSVEFALRDHQQRVSHSLPSPNPQPRINKVSFEGGMLNDRKFHLNSELNCLIGSRGSGKSSLIECLRYGLDLPVGEDSPYKENLVKAMMGNGGKISIEGYTDQDQEFKITRIHGNTPIVYLEGGESKLRPIDILPNVLYFGQKDLGVRRDNFESDLFDKLLSPQSTEDRDNEETLLHQLQLAVNDWHSVKSAAEKEKSYEQEQEQLKHKLDLFRQKGVEKQLERLTKFDADKNNLVTFIGELSSFRKNLEPDSYDWSDFTEGWLTVKSPELSAVSTMLQQALTNFKSIEAEHNSVMDKFDQLLVSLRNQLKLLHEKEKELQDEFAKIQREIDQPGLDLNEFRNLKQRYENLGKLLEAAKNRGGASKAALNKVLSIARKIQEHRRFIYSRRLSELQEKQSQLPLSLELKMDFEADKADFENFLKTKLTGTGFRQTSYSNILENYNNPFQIYEGGKKKIDEVLKGTADVDKLISAVKENRFDFLSYRVADKKEINYEGTSVRELSLGQRATALLQLLMSLDEQNILIIDQPEDDLDNETVYKQVVRPLLENKRHTQFIIATHNPNIPVLGDAELVHACHESNKDKYHHESGSLDSRITRDSIVNIMEGGEEAFKQRRKIYYQWTNTN